MKRFSYKSLFIILFLLLIGIVVLWKYAIPQKQVKAAWWNDGWNYRKAIVVNNNSNFDAINIPYKISVNTKDLIDNGKLQADADDVRIVDNEGNLVRHQVEKKTLNSVDTKIWFEVNVKSKTSSEYYLYYGNSSANLQNFESDIDIITSDTGSVVALMKDGFSYSTSYSYGRTSGIYKNGSSLNVTGNYHYTNAYPGNWWDDRVFTQSILNQTGPLFVEVNYSDTNYGGYSSYGTNIKIFDNGFAETMVYMTYNTSGSDTLYYYLNFSTGTRNSVWVNSSGVLVDQAANSGELYESTLGENWFGQRWVSDNKYGGTIITRNGIDWHHGGTSAQNSYYQTNYSYGQSYVAGTYREIRYGVFAGDGGLSEMQIKGANYGGLGSTVNTEETGGGPMIYWKFNEGTGVITNDSSGNYNGALMLGGTLPQWKTEESCLDGKCLYFSSLFDNRVVTPDYLLLNGSQSYSAWIYPTVASGLRGIVGTHDHSQNANLGVNLTGSRLSVSIGYTDETREYSSKQSMSEVILNKWNHVVLIFNQNENSVTLYLNGKYDSRWVLTKTVKFISGKLLAGQWSTTYSSGYKFDGMIDEIKIFPYALIGDQVKIEYASRSSLSGTSSNLGITSSTMPLFTTNLIAHYKFEEGSGSIVNNSVSDNLSFIGTFGLGSSSPTWTQGKIGKGLDFDGNDYIRIVDSSYIDLADNFSVSAWVYLRSQNGAGFVHKGNSTIKGAALSYGWNSNGFMFISWNGSNTPYDTLKSTDINRWHHLVGVVKNGVRYLYVDGNFVNFNISSVSSWNNDNDLYIGCSGNPSNCANSIIDEVKIYNKALSNSEVLLDFNQGSAIQFGQEKQNIGGTITSLKYCIPGDNSYCFPPVGEWNFEENQNTQVKDESGNAYHINLATGDSSPSWISGKKGAALSFDGNDYVNFTDSAGDNKLSNLSAATYSFWIYPTSLTSPPGGDQRLLEKRDSTISSTLRTDGNLVVYFWNATNFDNWISNKKLGYYDSGVDEWTVNNLNKWYFVTFVFDSVNNLGKTYINGILDKEYVLLNCLGRATGTIGRTTVTQFGRYRYGTSNFFVGKVDDIKIYNYARTPAQIAYDYNKGEPVAWFKFDECQGNIINNSSGIGITGIINIGSSGSQNSLGTCALGTSAAWTNGAIGKINSSLNFDGTDDYISISNISFTDSQPWSFSSWINHKDASTTFYAGRNSSNEGFLNNLSGNFAYRDKNAVYYSFSSTSSYMYKFTNLIWVADGTGNLSLYINGLLDKTISNVPTQMNFEMLGRGYSSNDYNFTGKMDDVRIYNYALTPEQIKLVYNNGAINFN